MKKNIEGGLFGETPEINEKHIVNYQEYMGSIIKRYRLSLSGDKKTMEGYGKYLSKYFGTPVGRGMICRAESGMSTVNWGVISATFYEMGVIPEFISILERGRSTSLQYMTLVFNELKPEIKESVQLIETRLRQKAIQEKLWK